VITYYGYSDGSGEYYIVIDTDKCNGCGKCVTQCPFGVLQLETEFIDLEDKTVASVTEQERKKLRYTCSGCKPETGKTPCSTACEQNAVRTSWKTT
jgi:ferredoxin